MSCQTTVEAFAQRIRTALGNLSADTGLDIHPRITFSGQAQLNSITTLTARPTGISFGSANLSAFSVQVVFGEAIGLYPGLSIKVLPETRIILVDQATGQIIVLPETRRIITDEESRQIQVLEETRTIIF
jgi:hypothetical protein